VTLPHQNARIRQTAIPGHRAGRSISWHREDRTRPAGGIAACHRTEVGRDFDGAPQGVRTIRHKEAVAAVIVDRTLPPLPRSADVSVAGQLPPHTIDWPWGQDHVNAHDAIPPTALPGLLAGQSGGDDWATTQGLLEDRPQLSLAKLRRFGRPDRLLGADAHPADHTDTEQCFDNHLQDTAKQPQDAFTPDTAPLATWPSVPTGWRLC
jgi:hypothetical protein